MAEQWLTVEEMRAWENFICTWGPLVDALETDLLPHQLTMGDYEVLVVLSAAEDNGMRMCDLADALRLSPSGLTRRLDGLVRAELVERRACPSDRRVMFAHLTDAGVRKLEAAAPDHVASVRRHLFAALTAEQVEQLGDIFVAVRQGLARCPQTA